MASSFQADEYVWLSFLRGVPGLLTIGCAVQGWRLAAGVCLVVAVWSDVAVGVVAGRKSLPKTQSVLQVEGFMDFLCFVWAPVQMALAIQLDGWVLAGAGLFVPAGIFRLARFNVEGLLGGGYKGLPVTYNGYIFPAIAVVLNYVSVHRGIALLVVFLGVAILMTSDRFVTPEM